MILNVNLQCFSNTDTLRFAVFTSAKVEELGEIWYTWTLD